MMHLCWCKLATRLPSLCSATPPSKKRQSIQRWLKYQLDSRLKATMRKMLWGFVYEDSFTCHQMGILNPRPLSKWRIHLNWQCTQSHEVKHLTRYTHSITPRCVVHFIHNIAHYKTLIHNDGCSFKKKNITKSPWVVTMGIPPFLSRTQCPNAPFEMCLNSSWNRGGSLTLSSCCF